MMWPWHCIPEDQHVERVRRRLAQFDRLRRWFVGLYVTLAVVFVWLVVKVCTLLAAILQAPNNAAPGFFGFGIGMTFGVGIGLLAVKIGHGLGSVLFGCRTDRLLVKYHDAVHATSSSATDALDSDDRRRT